MEQHEGNTKIAGIDVSKRMLDVGVHDAEDFVQVANQEGDFARMVDWLRVRRVGRVGLEATGGYERAIMDRLRAEGFEVVLHQPIEVRLFAKLKRLKAKNDKIDARLIAAATAQVDAVKAANDPLLGELAQRLTAYEQVSDLVAQLKTCREHAGLDDLRAQYDDQIRQLTVWKRRLAVDLLQRIKADPDLSRRYQLLLSLPGVGSVIAAVLVIRMPELGAMTRGQAAALIGVAPYDRDSGLHKGQRFIWGGRQRPRRFLYLAALAAKRFNPDLKAFAQRLLQAGKPPKVTTVAVMRKLIEAANLVLARGQPWVTRSAN